MARVVADNSHESFHLHDRKVVESAGGGLSPTLGQLLKSLSEVRTEVPGNESPAHQLLDMSGGVDVARTIPFVLCFSNLTYSVNGRRKAALTSIWDRRAVAGTKTILDDISGEARDGELMAVMGASGSGKSTLIDALANRIAKGSLKGSITLNGERLESKLLKVISAYVMQDDLLFPMLTVEETLMFAAEFRLPRSLSKSKKMLRVQALIDQLGLRNASKTVIGDEGHRGVSGGERRRVSIGTDIIHDPILLFLDEPTSGLDSTSALMVVKVLKRIAQSGSVVIMSIHQPSSRILSLLDRMIFLSRGQTVFNGAPSNLPAFFSDFGRPIPENDDRTEFVLDLIRQLEGNPDGIKTIVEFNRSWHMLNRGNQDDPLAGNGENLSLKEAISSSISKGKLVSGGGATSKSMVPKFANPQWIELVVLSKRFFKNAWRMPELFSVRLAAVMVTGLILATVFWRLDNTPKGVQERLGFIAFAMSTIFYTCADGLPVFIQERYIFTRETAFNAYRRSSYVLSHALTSIPSLLFLSASFAAATFWAVGLDGSFSFYFLIILASFWAGSGFVAFISGVVPQVMLGYVTVVALLSYFLLFSGFFINRERIPHYWMWFHYISLVKYPYEAVMQNEFSHPAKCFVRGSQIFDATALATLPEPLKEKLLASLSATLGLPITNATCVTTGADVLNMQSIKDLSKWNCLWVTAAWGFFFRILFYFCLFVSGNNKRR